MASKIEILAYKRELKRQLLVAKAKERFDVFVRYTDPSYQMKWFHKLVCEHLDMLERREIKKLMIFLPPQHGKSSLSSRNFPAYCLGKNPNTKVAVTGYAKTLVTSFSKDCQQTMEGQPFKTVFPEAKIYEPGGEDMAQRTNDYFEVIGGKGYYKAVGVGGGLTGFTVDVGIIDDPFKDRQEANSEVTRNKVWGWYNDVFKTRLHNESVQLMLFTRWHEDDLAGRILDPENEHYDEEEANSWTVLALPALREEDNNEWNTVEFDDPRKIDEALWEDKHGAQKYFERRRINPTGFSALDQQRPSVREGNKIQRDWFEYIDYRMLPFNPDAEITRFYIDGAFTDKTANDESAMLASVFFRGKLYVLNCHGVRKEQYEFLDYWNTWAPQYGSRAKRLVNIELKASGYPLKSMLEKEDYGLWNCRGIPDSTVALGKWNRVENAEPFLASGRVVLVTGGWNKRFIDQCAGFPNGKHDDMVDVLCYAIDEAFVRRPKKKDKPVDKKALGLR